MMAFTRSIIVALRSMGISERAAKTISGTGLLDHMAPASEGVSALFLPLLLSVPVETQVLPI